MNLASAFKSKRGVVLILVGVSLFVILNFFALVVDLGRVFVTKNELQNTSDAAALAAVVEIPMGETSALNKAISFGEAHRVANEPISIDPSDVVFGRYDISNETFQAGAVPTNAVEVQARRTAGSPSGPLGLFFAQLFGQDSTNVRAKTLAVLDPRVVGVHGKNRLIPYSAIDFVVDQNHDGLYDIGSVINIYPRNDAPGNFGFLDLDGGSNDVTELRDYIENGYDKDFTIPPGGSVQVSGSTGIDGNSLLNSFGEILNENVFLPVHNWVTGEGSSSIFNVTSLLAVKILRVKLNGNQDSRYIRVEIISFASSVLAVDPNAPENNSVAKPRLVV